MASPYPGRLTTGCLVLNAGLGGGIPIRSITELVSEGGVGKTQFCLQLALQAHLPVELGGLDGSCIYFYTECAFPLSRLQQIAAHMAWADNPMETVFVHHVADVDDLIRQLHRTDRLITNQPPPKPVKLVVVDSMASLFRGQFDNSVTSLRRRASYFDRIHHWLNKIATWYNVAVVTTNQVKDYFPDNGGPNSARHGYLAELWTSNRRVVPALGPSWRRRVDARIFLSRGWETVTDAETGATHLADTRRFTTLYGPGLPSCSLRMVIDGTGVGGRFNHA